MCVSQFEVLAPAPASFVAPSVDLKRYVEYKNAGWILRYCILSVE
jgi:hypothetical protein